MKTYNCIVCGSERERRHSKSNKFCSVQCQKDNEHKERIEQWKIAGLIGKNTLKRYLTDKNPNCWECGIKDWNGKPLVLELEHIDGNSDNNSEENVSLLCPNCHSQTPTYKGKNKGNGRHNRMKRYYDGKSY